MASSQEAFVDLVEAVSGSGRLGLCIEPLSFEGGFAIPGRAGLGEPLPKELQSAAVPRQTSYRAGRHAAALALERLGLQAVAPGYCAQGGLPLWPTGVQGSLTHTTCLAGPRSDTRYQVAGAMVRRARVAEPGRVSGFLGSVGLDAERVMDCARAGRLRSKLLSGSEAKVLSGFPENVSVTLLFSAKEALFKSTFLGFQVRCSLADLVVHGCADTFQRESWFALGQSAEVDTMGTLEVRFAGQCSPLNDKAEIQLFFWMRRGVIWTLALLEPRASPDKRAVQES